LLDRDARDAITAPLYHYTDARGAGAHARQMRISIGNAAALQQAAAVISDFVARGR
jgi:hypothetical protein